MIKIMNASNLRSIHEAAERFLELSEEAEGRWKGELSAVEEVRMMRKHKRDDGKKGN